MTRREYQADFADGDVFGTSFLRRPDAVSRSYLQSLAPGPRNVSDPTEGLLVKGWYCRADNDDMKVYLGEAKDDIRMGWHDEVEWFSYTGAIIQELDFAFDQNGAPMLAAQRASNLWIYYFKPSAGMYVFEDFGAGLYPKVVLDNPFHVEDSDLLVWYSAGGLLVYRKQRDLYVSSNATAEGMSGLDYVEGTVVDDVLRVHIIISTRDSTPGTWALKRVSSQLYPYYTPAEGMRIWPDSIQGEVLTVLIIYETEDEMEVNTTSISGEVKYVTWQEDVIDEPEFAATITAVTIIDLVILYTAEEGEFDVDTAAISGGIEDVVILYTAEEEEFDVDSTSISGAITTP